MRYSVVLFPEEDGGFSVEVPALPGCFSYGDSLTEALHMVQEAICCHLEGLRKDGLPAPQEGETVPLNTEHLSEALLFKVNVEERAAVV